MAVFLVCMLQFEVDVEDVTKHGFGGLPPPKVGDKIVIGVCAMKKKASSKPMREILSRLDSNAFEVVTFPQEVILQAPIEDWPLCHTLIAFFSDGYPLEKVQRYAELRKPFLVNDLQAQHLLKDRRHVLKLCEKFGIPVPEHVVVNRSKFSPSGFPVDVTSEDDLEEFDDYIVVNGKKMCKPFVEKPVDGDDHNIYIYYPRSAGGGSCRLFRKVKDRSSEFFPDENNVRRNGSFIYESFLRTEGSDVKVYTVGLNYAHSEARKSPSIDGVVSRNENGYEVRFPVLLTAFEKEIANTIIRATGQRICGFDVLRSDSKSYICDVNGWSFVKNNHKYYDDFALVLTDLLLRAMGMPTSESPFSLGDDEDITEEESSEEADDSGAGLKSGQRRHSSRGHAGDAGPHHEELRCVIAVVRHGDRTPKQKLKINVDQPKVLALFEKYGDRHQRGELKLKSARELGDVLSIVTGYIERIEAQRATFDEEDSDSEDFDLYGQLLQARSVLEMHGTFKGINRKVQLKPTDWDGQTGAITKAKFILKWGGVLTQEGRQQAELMGESFRQRLYPFDGLLRLHSTYRHDLKIYSSNEGRVQVTAAAFTKGMLQLEGHLTPILASLVRKSDEVHSLLDAAEDAKNYIQQVKERLHAELRSKKSTPESLAEAVAKTNAPSVLKAFEKLNFEPLEAMRELQAHIVELVKQLRICVRTQRACYGTNPGSVGSAAGIANPNALIGPSRDRSAGELPLSPSSSGGSSTLSNDSNASVASAASSNYGGSVAASLSSTSNGRKASATAGQVESIITKDNGTQLLMALYRWNKLESDFYNKKKDKFDLSKIPDIHDSVRYDLLHNPGLAKLKPPSLQSIFKLSQALADIVVPQEYGITPSEKKLIGSRISRSLVTKIQSDLRNTIAVSAGPNKSNLLRDASVVKLSTSPPAPAPPFTNEAALNASNPGFGAVAAGASSAAAPPKGSLTREMSTSTLASMSEAKDKPETLHRLDKRHARSLGIKSGDRHVRTRLYFTSESHLHALLNILRYAAAETLNASPDEIEIPPIDDQVLEKLGKVEELNYLTHIVFRLFEIIPSKQHRQNTTRKKSTVDRDAAAEGSNETGAFPARFRISVGVSPGVIMHQDSDVHFRQGEFQNLDQARVANAKMARQDCGSMAELELPPCSEIISVWKDLEYNKLDGLLSHVLNNVADDLSAEYLDDGEEGPIEIGMDLQTPGNA